MLAHPRSRTTPGVESPPVPADERHVTRRILLLAAAVLAPLAVAGTASAAVPKPPPPAVSAPAATTTPAVPVTPPAATRPARVVAGRDGWAAPAASRLIASGAWPQLAGQNLSRGATRADLDRAVGVLTGTPGRSAKPSARLTVYAAHLAVVRALGLEPERRGASHVHVDGGPDLRLPANAGSEILVRELGLVYNQLSAQDGRERSRTQTIRLADLVYMVDRARGIGSWQKAALYKFRDLELPAMTPQRRQVVQAAVGQIGQPYIWGGDWPTTASPWGWQAHGGFDCSGLVWWAFKGDAGSTAMSVGSGLLGRTADQMAWEKPSERIAISQLAPGDLVFFGPRGPKSTRGSIEHTAIALGNGWIVQSSGSRGGVSISFLADYWPSATAWGRDPAQLGG
jgi:cell wall-associated NlpC family hydrolase